MASSPAPKAGEATRPRVRRLASNASPSLRHERRLFREGASVVLGCDEVGRGALAGPVAVGLAAIRSSVSRFPRGLRDSKLMNAHERNNIAPRLRTWAHSYAVGFASAQEIDIHGLSAALRTAALRAFRELESTVVGERVVVLLDGNHDYLTDILAPLFDPCPKVETLIAADRTCAAVSAASVFAKVARDNLMLEYAASDSRYAWHTNKGYGTPEHRRALSMHGPCEFHRQTWLRGDDKPADDVVDALA